MNLGGASLLPAYIFSAQMGQRKAFLPLPQGCWEMWYMGRGGTWNSDVFWKWEQG